MGAFFARTYRPRGGRSPRQKYYNKIPKHEKMKCGIIEEDYTRTNEKKRLISVRALISLAATETLANGILVAFSAIIPQKKREV